MNRVRFRILLLLLSVFMSVDAATKQEVRAVWITSAYGLDWPRTKAVDHVSMLKQQQELVRLLDMLQAANFNTVLFQARTRGDVFYNSSIEPYSALLAGRCGKSPGYDPLAFAIEECHKRGMECHAWIVAIPLGSVRHVRSLGAQSVTLRHKKLCVSYRNEFFLNPGNPETKVYLMSLVREMVEGYDLDGVHFDYLRYPERAPKFPDRIEYKKYGNGRTINQWRRDNLTEIVRYLYHEVKKIKPWVKVSTSPVGKFNDTSRYSSRGWNAYNTVCQDVQGWLKEGIQDQIYPMMYFRDQHFYPFALDWKENSNQRHVVPGLGIYFLDPKEGNWRLDEVKRQINFIRNHDLQGAAFYRTYYLEKNTQGFYESLCTEFFDVPAIPPAMPWLDWKAPSAPEGLKAELTSNNGVRLQWGVATDNDERNAPKYIVYASQEYPVDTTDPENILAINVRETEFYYMAICPWMMKLHFAVTAVDRYGNEGEAVMTSLDF